MPEPKQRIVVDAVSFTSVFQFPKIFRAVAMAVQPPRLMVGLLIVAALMTVGRMWDGVTSPTVPPAGLLADAPTADDAQRAQQVYRQAIEQYVPADEQPEGRPAQWPAFTARDVLAMIQAGYQTQRNEAASTAEMRRNDEQYLRTIERIDEVRPKGTFEATAMLAADRFREMFRGTIYLQPDRLLGAAGDLFVRMPITLFVNYTGFAILFGLIFMLIVALGGGALSRMVACEFAGQERLRIQEAFDFSFGNGSRLFLTLLLTLLFVIGISVVIILLGALMELPWIDVIGGLLYGLGLLLGVAVAFLLICYLAGFSMLIPAVACENCDAADAQQRAFAYVLNRPLHLIGYGVIALLGLVFGYFVVSLFATTALNITAALFGLLTGNSAVSAAGGFELLDLTPREAGAIHGAWHSRWAAGLINFWQTIVVMLIIAFVFSYYFASATIVYLLMRRVCDGQEMTEIWKPGLVRGTLTPMPEPVVEREGHAEQPRTADKAAGAAMRTATAMRYGSKPAEESQSDTDTDQHDVESPGEEKKE